MLWSEKVLEWMRIDTINTVVELPGLCLIIVPIQGARYRGMGRISRCNRSCADIFCTLSVDLKKRYLHVAAYSKYCGGI